VRRHERRTEMAASSGGGGLGSRGRRPVARASKGHHRFRGVDRFRREGGRGALENVPLDGRGGAKTADRRRREPSRSTEYSSHAESRALAFVASPLSASGRRRRACRPRRARRWRGSRPSRLAGSARRRLARRRWIARRPSGNASLRDFGRRNPGCARSAYRSRGVAGRQVTAKRTVASLAVDSRESMH